MEDYRLKKISEQVGERVAVLKEFHRYCATPSGCVYNVETGRQIRGAKMVWYGNLVRSVVLRGSDTHYYQRILHILIAETFVRKPPSRHGEEFMVVAKDGDYLNCCADNLLWQECTPAHSTKHIPRKQRTLKQDEELFRGRTKVERLVWEETCEAGRRYWGVYDEPFEFNIAETDLRDESDKPCND